MAGGRVATAVTDHIVRALISTKVNMADHHVGLAMAIQEAFFGLTGKESAHNAGPILRKLVQTGELDPDMARLMGFIARGQGQFSTMLGNVVIGSAAGAGLGTLFTNALQPAIGPIVAATPNMPMAISDAVRAQVSQQGGHLDLAYEVAQQGMSGDKFDVLVNLAKTRPAATDVLDLLNRGHTNIDFTRVMLHRLGYSIEDAELMLELRAPLASPQQLATLTNFGVYTEEQSWALASRTGIPRDEFHALVLGDGQPPSIQELLFAYRRGFIDRNRLFHGIQQGPLRVEWFDIVEQLGQVPMDTESAIGAAVQGHLSVDQARRIALQNGLIPDQFQPLYDAHGEAPGVVQMLELLNRGFMSEAEVTAGIKETRLKDKYIPFMLKFAIKVPPERSVISLLSKGAITEAVALDMLLQLGYTREIAAALVAEAHKTKTQKLRDLTEAQVVALYTNRAITRDEARAMIGPIGYDPNETELILDLADAQWATKHINAGITRIQRSFLSGHIDDTDASTALDGIGVPAAQRDDLVKLWKVEQGTVTKALTVAQMVQAMKKGILSPDEVYPRLVGDGYSGADARIIIQLAGFDTGAAPQ